jgi:hypothetical protein
MGALGFISGLVGNIWRDEQAKKQPKAQDAFVRPAI